MYFTDKIVRLPMPFQLRAALYWMTNILLGKKRFIRAKTDLAKSVCRDLQINGYAVIDSLVDIEVGNILSQLEGCFLEEERTDTTDTGDHIGAPSGITYVNISDLLKKESVISFCEHPLLLDIADQYLGCRSKIAGVASWRSRFVGDRSANAQLFHRDLDALKWLKVFIYLTDVTDQNGPHVYVKKTHKLNKFLSFRRIWDDEIVSSGLEEVHIKGLKGTVIVADSFGLHKGLAPKEGHRAILQVTYCRDRLFMTEYPKNSQLTGPRWKFFN